MIAAKPASEAFPVLVPGTNFKVADCAASAQENAADPMSGSTPIETAFSQIARTSGPESLDIQSLDIFSD
jgi:hypothetical protein